MFQAVYVMPSSSARCSQLPRAVDKVPFYEALKKFRDHLVGKLPDLQDSEITFPDLELKTAKKEPKEEVKEEYPAEGLGLTGEDGLQQMMAGAYNVLPHTMASTYQDSQCNVISSQGLPQIKLEPGTYPPPPPPQLQQMVTVKQEPGLDMPSSCPSQSNGLYQSQGYSQGPGTYSQLQGMSNSIGMNSSSNGLDGLMARFGGQSEFGVVKQVGSISGKPMQFNDALCDILTEGSSFELVQESPAEETASEQNATNKKPNKSRKRKSASSTEISSPEPSVSNQVTAEGQSPQSFPQANASSTYASSVPLCQPVPQYTHPSVTQGYALQSPPAMMGLSPFSQPPLTQSMQGYNVMMDPSVSQATSYTQMMNVSLPYQPMVTNPYSFMSQMSQTPGAFQGHPQFQGHSQSSVMDHQGQYQGPQPPQAVTVKQEKPDA